MTNGDWSLPRVKRPKGGMVCAPRRRETLDAVSTQYAVLHSLSVIQTGSIACEVVSQRECWAAASIRNGNTR